MEAEGYENLSLPPSKNRPLLSSRPTTVLTMKHPRQLLDFWADQEAWIETPSPTDWPVSEETAELFLSHLNRLRPVAESGNDHARYAMASIYLLQLIYPDKVTREERFEHDQMTMTQLLCQCAENGMSAAFDNLVTSGIGEAGDSARYAANEYERIRKPEWSESDGMPIYTPNWMESAMKLWLAHRGADKASDEKP